MKKILSNTFWQLIFVYTLLILLISLGGIFLLKDDFNELFKNKNKSYIKNYFHIILFVLAVFLIVIIRIIPYIKNGFYLPLGYDAGLYKYSIEYGLFNFDVWIINGMEPGFLYFMTFLHIFIPTDILLIYVFILFIVILGISIYIFSKEYFNKDVALLSLIIYSISAIQFKVFTYLYYKT